MSKKKSLLFSGQLNPFRRVCRYEEKFLRQAYTENKAEAELENANGGPANCPQIFCADLEQKSMFCV